MSCKTLKEWKGCCCECDNQVTIFRHPLSPHGYKGSVMESNGKYLCLAPELSIGEPVRGGFVFSKKHGMCEMFHQKTIKESI